jgi:hypothetical protein
MKSPGQEMTLKLQLTALEKPLHIATMSIEHQEGNPDCRASQREGIRQYGCQYWDGDSSKYRRSRGVAPRGYNRQPYGTSAQQWHGERG